ncbi:MAG TPA: glycosyltransferase family 2 protein [Sphingomonadaceae bacterium]|nr:glycosyltransferase family 2 protein [Sphingomonadaceae bacterium]
MITFVLPYYNEADFIGATLASLARQEDRRFALVLVDNASSDNGTGVARAIAADMPDIDIRFIAEPEPGKLNALRAGMRVAQTEFVGTLDADTIYPPHYVARVLGLFERIPAASMVLAFGQAQGETLASSSRWLQARLFPRHCLTGGFGQAFRRELLERAGGFDPQRWPYVLEDHEIVHRVVKLGPLVYARDHVCFPSDRRQDRSECSWNLTERVLYKALPERSMDWFFYQFLGPRFEERGLRNIRLRDQAWRGEDAASS